MPPMRQARYGCLAAALGDRHVLVAGGASSCNRAGIVPLDSVERFDTVGGRWESMVPMSKARAFASSTTHCGKIYVLGGLGVAQVTDAAEVYTPASGAWVSLPGMSVPRLDGAV